MHTHEITFTLRLDAETHKEIARLSEMWRCSRAEAIRRAVQHGYQHSACSNPMCADGQKCMVPQMHVKKAVGQ